MTERLHQIELDQWAKAEDVARADETPSNRAWVNEYIGTEFEGRQSMSGTNGIDYRDRMISDIARREARRISRKVILSLQRMTEGLQSGDDTRL